MKNEQVAPSLRFKKENGEDYPPWEQRKLRDLGDFNPKSVLPEEFEYVDLESVVGTELLGHRKEMLSAAPSRAQRLAAKGDIFFQTVRPYQKHNFLFDRKENNFVFSTGYAQIRPWINPYFLFNLLQTDSFVKRVLDNCTGTSYPAISSGVLSSMIVSISPSNNEREQIGLLFLKLDRTITLHQRKVESVKKLKKSLLQKMFPKEGETVPAIRFPGFTDAWEQRKLDEFAEKTIQRNADFQYAETFTNSAEFGIITQRDFFDHSVSKITNLDTYYIVGEDDFVYNPRISSSAPFGPINRNKLGRTGVISPLYTVFRSHDIDKTYLEYFFKSSCWHQFMYFNGDSGARADRYSIKDSVLFQMPIPVPCMNEQKEIGSLFKSIDEFITLHQRKLETLKKLKKALLQRMFI